MRSFFRHTPLVRESRILEPRIRPNIPAPKPALPPAKNASISSPASQPKIEHVNPDTLIPEIAAATAFSVAALVPKTASAGMLEKIVGFFHSEVTDFSWKGILALGATFGVLALIRMYFNPQYKARPGDPTPKRILGKIVLPWLGAGLMVGSAIYAAGIALPFIAAPLMLPASTVYLMLLGGAAGVSAYLFARSIVKEIYNRTQTVKLDLNKHSFKNRLLTNFISYGGQLADAIYMTYRAVTLSAVTASVGVKIALGLLNPAALLADIALGAGIGLLYYLGVHRKISQFVNRIQHPSKPMQGPRSMLRLAFWGAVAGALISAGGPMFVLNLGFAFAFFAAEAFGMMHAWRWNTSARSVEETPVKIYSDQDVINAALLPETQYVTMFKTGFASNLEEVVTALWVNIHTRQGTNWEVAQTNGQDPFSNRNQFDHMLNGLNRLMAQNALYRSWIKQTDGQIEAAERIGDTARALEAMADLYDRLAAACTQPCSDNNGVPAYLGNFTAYGFTGFANEDRFLGTTDDVEHNRAMGRRIYTLGGVFIKKKADELRGLAREYQDPLPNFSGTTVLKPAPEEVIAILKRAVDQLYRKHNVPMQMIAPYMFSNRRLQVSIAKIGTLNKYEGYVKEAWTGMSLVRFNPVNQRFYLELIPTKVTRVLKTEHDEAFWKGTPDEPNYRQTRNADSRPGEDNRYKWVDRPIHTIGEFNGDILYIDNSDHFRAHSNDLAVYPTAFNQEVPALDPGEYFDVVFKDGFRLRMFGDGTVMHLDKHKNPLSQRMAPTDANTRGVRWLAGIQAPADDLLKCVNAKRTQLGNKHENGIEDYDVTWVKQAPFKPKYYFFSRTPYQSLSDSEQVDLIVTDFLANFEEDQQTPYIFLQWRVKEDRRFDFNSAMLDSQHDKVIMGSPSIAFFTLKVKERGTQRTLYIPYNLQKEWFPAVNLYTYVNRPDRSNENVTVPEWKQIDEKEGAALVTPATDVNCPFEKALRVKVGYTSRENRDGKVTDTPREYYRYLWYPRYLEDPGQYEAGADGIPKVGINVHQEKIGPAPFVKFTVVRKNQDGEVIMRDGTVVDQSAWETLVTFKPLSEHEYRKSRPDIQEKAPWADNDGNVHLPRGVTINGANVVDYFIYNQLRERLMDETLYERFLPAPTYLHHYEPAEIE